MRSGASCEAGVPRNEEATDHTDFTDLIPLGFQFVRSAGRRGSDAVGLLIREIRVIRGPWVGIGGIRMTRPRVFRDAISARDAWLEVSRCAGTQSDPQIVDAFRRVIQVTAATE